MKLVWLFIRVFKKSRKQVALLWQRDRATRLSVEILQLENIAIVWHLRDPKFGRFYTIPKSDRHTHRQIWTDRYTTTACTALSIASRGKNRPYCTRPTKYNYYAGNRASVDSKLLGRARNIWTIMLKLHLIDSLSICYTIMFATDTVTNRTDGV